MLLWPGRVKPVELNGTDVEEEEDTFTFPLMIETTVGCFMNDEEIGVKRQVPDDIVDEFAEDEDDDDAEDVDELVTDAPMI
jgi:hypothetical protein